MEKEKRQKWWRRFWPPTIIACSVLIVFDGILYLLGYTALSQLCGGILVVFAAIPLVYGVRYLQIRYQNSKKMQLMNRIAFIGVGGVGSVDHHFLRRGFHHLGYGLASTNRLSGAGADIHRLIYCTLDYGRFYRGLVGQEKRL